MRVDTNGEPGSPPKRVSREARGSPESFGQRAAGVKKAIAELAKKLDGQIRREPYAAMGVACAVGLGAGILLGSRILRAVAVSAASGILLDLGRAYLRQEILPKKPEQPAEA